MARRFSAETEYAELNEVEALARKLCEEDGEDPDKFCGIACYGQQGGVLLRGYHKYANQAARILADENRLTSPLE